MDVPSTVETALEDRPVEGAVCLEAGAGVGNTTAGLLAAGAGSVYAITNEADDARAVRERVGAETPRVVALTADLRETPLKDDAAEVITAHGLFNVLPPASLESVASELSRVAAPGCHLLLDDYEPPPGDAAVRDLFAIENAATQLAEGRPALSFYPSEALRRLFVGYGWRFDRERTLLDPVPWTEDHLEAHAEVARAAAEDLPEPLRDAVVAEISRRSSAVDAESTGRMYGLAFRLPG